jgi:hypothetical protein
MESKIENASHEVKAMQFHENPDNRRVQLLEVLVFLFLIVPSMVLSLFVIRLGGLGFVLTATSVILRDIWPWSA